MRTLGKQLRVVVHLWGPRACFRRPECKDDLVSYDALTPVAARQILAAFTPADSASWLPERVTMLHAPRIGLANIASRTGRVRRVFHLIDVEYIVAARLDVDDHRAHTVPVQQTVNDFARRIRERRPLRAPYFGLEEFPVDYALIEPGMSEPRPNDVPDNVGWLLYDTAGSVGSGARFFRPRLIDGSFDIPADPELVS